jgi:hypothetical protein
VCGILKEKTQERLLLWKTEEEMFQTGQGAEEKEQNQDLPWV